MIDLYLDLRIEDPFVCSQPPFVVLLNGLQGIIFVSMCMQVR